MLSGTPSDAAALRLVAKGRREPGNFRELTIRHVVDDLQHIVTAQYGANAASDARNAAACRVNES